MITGYNTDIEFDGIVYHVQTEDKGVATPVIMSLVYDRGTILASKRAPYDDLINGSVDEDAVAERLQRQHKLICAAVSAGRIEDLKQMSARNLKAAAAKRTAKKGTKPVTPEVQPETPEIQVTSDAVPVDAAIETRPPVEPMSKGRSADPPAPTEIPPIESVPETASEPPPSIETTPPIHLPVWPGPDSPNVHVPDTIPYFRLNEVLHPPTEELAPIAKPTFEPLQELVKNEVITGSPVIEDLNIVADEPVMIPLDAVEAVSDLAGRDRPENSRLNIDIIGEARFTGGERKEVCVMVCRGNTRKVVARAEVMVKVLGSDFRPVIYHATTDTNGIATIDVKIPQFRSGRASMIARAISDGEEVEVRSAVAHG